MADKLVIVESPAKANTIKKFLGGSTKVVASMGHIRDLPKSKMGIDIEHDFEPEYINIRGKGDLIKSLKKEAKQAKQVYIATDPDREGEAIAWHLAYILKEEKSKIRRVTFNEIKPLYETVQKSINCLKTGGRLCIITFQSLEDRAVKNAYIEAKGKCTCPSDLPYCVCGSKSLGTIITKKPIIASEVEQEENSRSKSAKLRIFEKNY